MLLSNKSVSSQSFMDNDSRDHTREMFNRFHHDRSASFRINSDTRKVLDVQKIYEIGKFSCKFFLEIRYFRRFLQENLTIKYSVCANSVAEKMLVLQGIFIVPKYKRLLSSKGRNTHGAFMKYLRLLVHTSLFQYTVPTSSS